MKLTRSISSVVDERDSNCVVDDELVHSDIDTRCKVVFRFSSRQVFLRSFSSSLRIKPFLIPAAEHRSNRHFGHLRRVSCAIEH